MNSASTIRLNTGRVMPVIGFGTWQCQDDTAGTVARALQYGYRMIDTSGDYGTQPGVGEGLKQSGVDRKEIYIVTKVEEDDDAYKATKKNLSEMDIDYADLMLIHRPPQEGVGGKQWRGLTKARDDGLTKDIGVSNYPTTSIQILANDSGVMPVVNQVEWSPFGYSQEMFEFCQDNDIAIQAYSPLTRGERLDDSTLEEISSKHGKTPAQVLLRWNLQLGTVPLPKANKREHLEENLDIYDFELSDDEMSHLNGLNENYSALSTKPVYMTA